MTDWNTERPPGLDDLLDYVAAEISACEHRGDSWFDRTICPEPCDTMHQRCSRCGSPVDRCHLHPSQDHWPMHVQWENRHTVPAEVCDTCSDVANGSWVPASFCEKARARMLADPYCTYTYGVLRREEAPE